MLLKLVADNMSDFCTREENALHRFAGFSFKAVFWALIGVFFSYTCLFRGFCGVFLLLCHKKNPVGAPTGLVWV